MELYYDKIIELIQPVVKRPNVYGIFNSEFIRLFSKGLSVGLNIESIEIIDENFNLIQSKSEFIEVSVNNYSKVLESIKKNNQSFSINNVYRFNAFQVGYFFGTLVTGEKGVDILMYNKEYERYLLDIWSLPTNLSRPYFSIIQYVSYNPKESLKLFFKTYEDYHQL